MAAKKKYKGSPSMREYWRNQKAKKKQNDGGKQ
jgi:hypothetical protein